MEWCSANRCGWAIVRKAIPMLYLNSAICRTLLAGGRPSNRRYCVAAGCRQRWDAIIQSTVTSAERWWNVVLMVIQIQPSGNVRLLYQLSMWVIVRRFTQHLRFQLTCISRKRIVVYSADKMYTVQVSHGISTVPRGGGGCCESLLGSGWVWAEEQKRIVSCFVVFLSLTLVRRLCSFCNRRSKFFFSFLRSRLIQGEPHHVIVRVCVCVYVMKWCGLARGSNFIQR